MAKFIYPTDTMRVTSGFRGDRPDHHGVDLAEAGYHPIYAAASGKVSRSYFSSSYGECIMIVHTIDGVTWETVYAHMRSGSRTVKEGDYVTQGQTIGVMGSTGQAYGQHLHFELHKGGWNINKSNAVNPLDYLGKGDGGNTGNGSDPTDVDTRKTISLPSGWETNNIGFITVTQPHSKVYSAPSETSEHVGDVPKGSGHVYLDWHYDGSRFRYKIAENNWICQDVCKINKDGKTQGVVWISGTNINLRKGASTGDPIVNEITKQSAYDVHYRYENWIYVTGEGVEGWMYFDESYTKWLR
ncbi:M23 family metallopeptidase [Bacillus pseudomycoides]|nr:MULTISPECIES: M23 family metallopeptidase [Bacillus]MCX2829227.1 M23 family metallopeptidase [Bacillus sp. DHT2]MDR4918695.1 M23 family metallopeptidase [Bacillus pseudomycoides]